MSFPRTFETSYLALIHKDDTSGYGVSFPDVPGVIAVADAPDKAMSEGAAALRLALEDWEGPLPASRSIDTLRADPEFNSDASDAEVVTIWPSKE